MTTALPKTLYHGSAFCHTNVLRPGYEWTHRLVKWDQTENNHFLYASTDKEATIEQGFASAIEKKYGLDRFTTNEESILIVSPYPKLALAQCEKLEVYLYTIEPKEEHGWVKNNNEHNNISTEWKTKKHFSGNFTVEPVNVARWIKTRDIVIEHDPKTIVKRTPRANFSSW